VFIFIFAGIALGLIIGLFSVFGQRGDDDIKLLQRAVNQTRLDATQNLQILDKKWEAAIQQAMAEQEEKSRLRLQAVEQSLQDEISDLRAQAKVMPDILKAFKDRVQALNQKITQTGTATKTSIEALQKHVGHVGQLLQTVHDEADEAFEADEGDDRAPAQRVSVGAGAPAPPAPLPLSPPPPIKSPVANSSLYTLKSLPSECPVCDPKSWQSCGRCFRVGYRHWATQSSRILEVENVVMQEGKAWFVGPSAERMMECGHHCGPTWEWWPLQGHKWPENDDEELNQPHTSPDIMCIEDEVVTQPAMIVNWLFPMNLFHFLMETVLSTFMALGHIQEIFGCPEERVAVYISAGFKDTPFKTIWKWVSSHRSPRPMNDMNGCYRQVFYGHMVKDYLRVNDPLTYAPILSSWMTAFRRNLRATFLSAADSAVSLASSRSKLFLDVRRHDHRTLQWMQNISWMKSSIEGVEVRHIYFEDLNWAQQIGKISKASGLLGVAGSGLAQQVFLPIGASVLQVTPLSPLNPSDLLGTGPCAVQIGGVKQHDSNSKCYPNSAVNSGNSLLNWRWCRPNITEPSAAYTEEEAQAIFKLFLSVSQEALHNNTVAICTVIKGRNSQDTSGAENLAVDTWPKCDTLAAAPIAPPLSGKCKSPFPFIGQPFKPQKKRTKWTYCVTDDYCY